MPGVAVCFGWIAVFRERQQSAKCGLRTLSVDMSAEQFEQLNATITVELGVSHQQIGTDSQCLIRTYPQRQN
jgi:hypothetical protein